MSRIIGIAPCAMIGAFGRWKGAGPPLTFSIFSAPIDYNARRTVRLPASVA
jgi:hypothetical protein